MGGCTREAGHVAPIFETTSPHAADCQQLTIMEIFLLLHRVPSTTNPEQHCHFGLYGLRSVRQPACSARMSSQPCSKQIAGTLPAIRAAGFFGQLGEEEIWGLPLIRISSFIEDQMTKPGKPSQAPMRV